MNESQGWAQVIKFDSIKPVELKALPPADRAQRAACVFANEVIDVFNNHTLPVRLASVAKLAAMVGMLSVAAVMASVKRLPYVEPNLFKVEKADQKLPLFHFTEDKPQ